MFRDSAVENLREFFERFRRLNIASVRKQLQHVRAIGIGAAAEGEIKNPAEDQAAVAIHEVVGARWGDEVVKSQRTIQSSL